MIRYVHEPLGGIDADAARARPRRKRSSGNCSQGSGRSVDGVSGNVSGSEIRHVGESARWRQGHGVWIASSRDRILEAGGGGIRIDGGKRPGGGVDAENRNAAAPAETAEIRDIGEFARGIDGDREWIGSRRKGGAGDRGERAGCRIDAVGRYGVVNASGIRHVDEFPGRIERECARACSGGTVADRGQPSVGFDLVSGDGVGAEIRRVREPARLVDRDAVRIGRRCRCPCNDVAVVPQAAGGGVDGEHRDRSVVEVGAIGKARHDRGCGCGCGRSAASSSATTAESKPGQKREQ